MKANKGKVLRYLHTARGQMDGICKMIEEDRYCMEIVNQISASIALLKKTEREVLTGHLAHCVKEANKEEDLDEKINELERLLDRLLS